MQKMGNISCECSLLCAGWHCLAPVKRCGIKSVSASRQLGKNRHLRL